MKNSDSFHLIEQNRSRDLFISVKYRENDEEIQQPPRFAYWATVADLPVNRIFIRDPHRSHYHRGIPDVSPDVYGVCDAVADFIRARRIHRVVIVGTSAGGYMALLLGKLIERRFPHICLRVHSYDPQTLLRYEQEKPKIQSRWGYIPGPSPTPELMDLVPIFKEAPSLYDQCYVVHRGTEWEDREHVRRLARLRRMEFYGTRPAPRLLVKATRQKESPHGTMIVRQSQSGRLRSLIFKEFDLTAA